MSILSNLFTKAGKVNVQNQPSNFLQFMTGDSPLRSYTPVDLVKLNTNYVAICNGKNASTCASIPLKLYYSNPGKTIELTSYKTLSKPVQKRIAKQLRLQKAIEIVEIDEHPALDLLSKVNPGMNGWDFTSMEQLYLGLIGNAYARIESGGEKPIALYPLLSEYVTVMATGARDGVIKKYVYELPNQPKVEYLPEEILHFKNYAPGNNIIGRGELEQCVSAVDLFNYAIAYEAYLGKNNGRPDFAIDYTNVLSEKDLKEISKDWRKKFSGVQNSGKPVITSGEFKIINLGFNPKDMSYSQLKNFCQKEIANSYGIPEALLELNSSNLASALTAIQQYRMFTIYPKMSQYVQKINEVLMPMYDKNLYLWFDQDEISDPNLLTNITSALAAGIITVAEARHEMGLEPLEVEDSEPVKETDER